MHSSIYFLIGSYFVFHNKNPANSLKTLCYMLIKPSTFWAFSKNFKSDTLSKVSLLKNYRSSWKILLASSKTLSMIFKKKKKIKSATFEIYKRFVPAEIKNHNDIRQLDHLKILLRTLAATTLAVASHVINAICIAYIHIFIYI